MNCKNCGNEFEGNFCNQCGQKNIERRFTTKEILHDFFHSFTHIDKGAFFLIKELFFRPGTVAKEYIEGKRKKYYNPLQFLIITVAIATFLAVNFNLFGPRVNPDLIKNLSETQKFFLHFNNFIYKYFNLILFFSVPVCALYSWIIFRKARYNYAENLIFNSFIAGERTIFYVLLTPLFYIAGPYWFIPLSIYYVGWNVYFVMAYIQFFGGNKLLTTGKYLLVFLMLLLTSQGLSLGIFTLFFY